MAGLLAMPALASAAAHPFKEVFGPTAQPTLTSPGGMAVDQASGDLYVIDIETQTLHRYKADGTPDNFSALAANVIDGHAGEADEVTTGPKEILSSETLKEFGAPGPLEVEVAVAPAGSPAGTAGDIYVTDAFNSRIVVFAPSGEYLGQKSLGVNCGVATDPSGNLYVADLFGEGGRVHKLVPTGSGAFTESGTFLTPNPCQLAAGSGFVFASLVGGPVAKIASEGAEEGKTEYTIDTGTEGGNTEVAVDPSTGNLFVVKPSATGRPIREYSVSGASPALLSSTPLASEGWGVAINGTSGNLYATRSGNTGIETFEGHVLPVTHLLTVNKNGTGTGGVVSIPPGINCGATCSAEFEHETLVKLKGTPDEHSLAPTWTGCDAVVSGECEVKMSAAKEVTATFALEKHTLTVIKNGTGAGTVESTPAGINCGATCAAEFEHNTLVKLKGTPAPHSKAVEWTGCDAVVSGECEVTMSAAKEVTATFNAITHTLGLSTKGTGTGSFTCSINGALFGPCPAQVNEGAKVEIKATPTPGSSFKTFLEGTGSAAACATTNPCVITEFLLDSTLKGEFTKNTHTLAITPAGNGSGTVECKIAAAAFGPCPAQVNEGSKVEIKATASAGSSFTGFSGGTGSASACSASPCVIAAFNADSALTVTFTKITHTLAVSSAGTGSGTVTCNGGPCAPSYDQGTSITLAATAASGSSFSGFSGACTGTSCTVVLNADAAVTATFTLNPPPPPPVQCVVPKLAKKTLAQAKSALKKAHCKLGKVTKPRKAKGALVVKSSSPGAGRKLAENAKVNVKLGPKPKKGGK